MRMVIQGARGAVSLACTAITGKASGLWLAIRAHIEGRNALHLERERRTTLLNVPQSLPPGVEVYDLRADGSVLQMRMPQTMRIDVIPEGQTGHSAPRRSLRAPDEDVLTAQSTEE